MALFLFAFHDFKTFYVTSTIFEFEPSFTRARFFKNLTSLRGGLIVLTI